MGSGGHGPILLRPAAATVQSARAGLPPIGILVDMMEEASPAVRLGAACTLSSPATASRVVRPDGHFSARIGSSKRLDSC
jgi:hypothetical protein